jgi:hypothetical protein
VISIMETDAMSSGVLSSLFAAARLPLVPAVALPAEFWQSSRLPRWLASTHEPAPPTEPPWAHPEFD